jgi:hypothetical protein
LAKLEELRVKAGRSVAYVIPDVVDENPEGVSLTIQYQGLAKLPSFATFDPKSRTLKFSPLSGQQTSSTFKFYLVITDSLNAFTCHSLIVHVESEETLRDY